MAAQLPNASPHHQRHGQHHSLSSSAVICTRKVSSVQQTETRHRRALDASGTEMVKMQRHARRCAAPQSQPTSSAEISSLKVSRVPLDLHMKGKVSGARKTKMVKMQCHVRRPVALPHQHSRLVANRVWSVAKVSSQPERDCGARSSHVMAQSVIRAKMCAVQKVLAPLARLSWLLNSAANAKESSSKWMRQRQRILCRRRQLMPWIRDHAASQSEQLVRASSHPAPRMKRRRSSPYRLKHSAVAKTSLWDCLETCQRLSITAVTMPMQTIHTRGCVTLEQDRSVALRSMLRNQTFWPLFRNARTSALQISAACSSTTVRQEGVRRSWDGK
jgi:hypothetical protein